MNEQTWLQRLDELIAAIHARVDADQNPISEDEIRAEVEAARSATFGIWADREDIEDSVTFSRQLRDQSPSTALRAG